MMSYEIQQNITALSKTISHALRHEPWLYELELDDEGWVSLECLLSRLRTERGEWRDLNEVDLAEMIAKSSKQRHELKHGKIRALYGHSTPDKLLKDSAEPPEILYHGTSPEVAAVIVNEGIKPMQRHYVHLSTDIDTAKQVGYRKSPKPKLILVKAKEAFVNSVAFYIGNEHVWLADYIPSSYIELI